MVRRGYTGTLDLHSNARNVELAEPYNKALANLTKMTENDS